MRLLENMILSGHCRSKHMCIYMCIYIYEFLTIMKLACLLHQVIVGCSCLPYFWLLILITRQIDTSTQSQINHSSRVQGKEFERSPPSSSPSRGPVMGGSMGIPRNQGSSIPSGPCPLIGIHPANDRCVTRHLLKRDLKNIINH